VSRRHDLGAEEAKSKSAMFQRKSSTEVNDLGGLHADTPTLAPVLDMSYRAISSLLPLDFFGQVNPYFPIHLRDTNTDVENDYLGIYELRDLI
jgi:hypothetical protein